MNSLNIIEPEKGKYQSDIFQICVNNYKNSYLLKEKHEDEGLRHIILTNFRKDRPI